MKEDACYKGVYCGLCHQLSKDYGLLSRFVLNFDLTFLSLVALGLAPQAEEIELQPRRCPFAPWKKKHCPPPSEELSTIAALSMMMFYYKVKDNQTDAGMRSRLGAWMLLPFAHLAWKKARGRHPEMDALMADCIAQDATIAAMRCEGIDQAADPTAQALSQIVATFAQNPAEQLVLARFGYLIGKYVYLMDATDDWENDRSSGDYNVFVVRFGDDRTAFLEASTQTLNLIIAQIAEAYNLLSLHRFAPIVDNMIYQGLHHSLRTVTGKARGNTP